MMMVVVIGFQCFLLHILIMMMVVIGCQIFYPYSYNDDDSGEKMSILSNHIMVIMLILILMFLVNIML